MILSLFDASCKIRDAFKSRGYNAISLDSNPGYNGAKVDLVTDILNFNYQAYTQNQFEFLFIALPCQTYSIASGAFHFKKGVPVTSTAINAINILIKVYQITQYFKCPFIIENPAGGLINNNFFKAFFKLNVSRLTLQSFGFPTQKKTDLFYNFDMLLLSSPTVRCNGRYNAKKLDNMSYRQRVTYPDHFVNYLVENIVKNVKLN